MNLISCGFESHLWYKIINLLLLKVKKDLYLGEICMKKFIERLKIWFSYWKVTKNIYDFDYSCILYSELYHLKILYNGLNKYHNHSKVDINLQRINLCIKLLKIIINDDFLQTQKYNIKNYKRFLPDSNYFFISNFPGVLYQEKAWKLYNILKERYMRYWWD